MQTPWLGLFGDLDGSIPVDDVEHLRTALIDAPRAEPMSFGMPTPITASTATRGRRTTPTPRPTAWNRTLVWFDSHLALELSDARP